MKNILLVCLLAVSLYSCNETKKEKVEPKVEEKTKDYSSLLKQAQSMFGSLPEYAENKENPRSAEKIALGKKLFFDKRLSKDNTISCNSCHNLKTGGVDNLPFSPGNDEGTFGGRNSPTVLNAALHIAQFWDGRNKDVEEQAGGPILNPIEMAIPNKEFLMERLSNIEEYQEMFKTAFPNEENPFQYINVQKSIGVFERALMTPSKFDNFLAGNQEALSIEEKEGLETFISAGCISCHMGNALGGKMYQKFGVYGNYWDYTGSEIHDEGRFEHTKNEADKYFFKVPTLRNVSVTFPYFHDGSIENLDKAIEIMGKAQLNKDLSEKEIKSIHVFLDALTGEVPADLME